MCLKWHVLYVLLLFVSRAVHTSAQCSIGYTGPNPSLWCTCNAGYTGLNVFASYSTTVCTRFFGLTKQPSFSSVATRNNVAVGTMPTYNPLGGPKGMGHFSFDRTRSQWLNAGSRTLNIATNGGFTFVVVVRFTGNPGNFERIIDLGVGPGNTPGPNSIIVCRYGISTDLYVKFWNGGGTAYQFRATRIVQNSWLSIIVTYRSSTRFYQVAVNSNIISTVATALTDRTLSFTSMGMSLSPANDFLSADVAGCFVVDEYLGIYATTAIVDAMSNGVDLTDTTCPSGSPCTACAAGTYKIETGSAGCMTCPVGSTSPASSTSSTECIVTDCNTGYTNPDGVACLSCVTGTYKDTKGSQVCTLCPNNTYSTAIGANASSTCQPCQGNSTAAMGSNEYTDCHCLPGFLTQSLGHMNATCELCSVGSYNPTLGATTCSKCAGGYSSSLPGAVSIEHCLGCMLNLWSPEGAAQCEFCPSNTTAAALSNELNDCKCVAGYYPTVSDQDGVTCHACPAGTFKPVEGPSACTNCGSGTYSATPAATAAAVCLACPSGSVSPSASTTVTDCTCPMGYQFACLDDTTWTGRPTSPGSSFTYGDCSTYATGNNDYCVGDGACSICCQACKNRCSNVNRNGSPCVSCIAGTYKGATGSTPCTNCGSGTYSPTAAATSAASCLACLANSGASCTGCSAAAGCACNPGYALLVDTCVCDLGYEPGT
jgi:hypothetical protein